MIGPQWLGVCVVLHVCVGFLRVCWLPSTDKNIQVGGLATLHVCACTVQCDVVHWCPTQDKTWKS